MSQQPTYKELERRIGELEERLRINSQIEAEEHHRRILDCSPSAIYTKDLEGRYTSINNTFENLSGLKREEVIGKTDFDLFPTPVAENSTKNDKQVIQQGAPTEIEEFGPVDGKMHTFVSTKYPLLAEDGTIYGICGVSSDITERKKMEASLVRSEERLALMLKGSNDAPWDWDLISNELYYSPQWWAQLGYKPDELPAHASLWEQLMHPEDAEHVDTVFRGALKTGIDSYKVEFRLLHKQGHYVSVLSRGFITRDANGTPVRVTGTNMDLSERKQAENDLYRSNRGLEVLKEAGRALLRAKNEVRLTEDICRIIVETGGYAMSWVGSAEEYPEKNVKPFGSWGIRADYLNNITITWDDSATGHGPTGTAIRTKTTQIARNLATDADYEPWRKAALGKGFQSSIALPIVYENTCLGALNIYSAEPDAFDRSEVELLVQLSNELAYGIIALRSKKAQQEAEEALRKSHERFLTVLNSIDGSIHVVDMQNYEILFMNKHFIDSFGRDMTGEVCWKALRGESEKCSYCRNNRLLDENGQPTGVLTWHDRNPITERWYINYDRAIEWTDGRLVKIQIATDISEMKHMEEQLRQAQKMESIGTLAGGIAHEFNNMLGIILGYTELAEEDIPDWNPAKDSINEIRTAAFRAQDVVQTLLSVARKTPESRKPIQVGSIIRESVEFMRGNIPATINIRINIACSTEMILGDAAEISKIVKNLCTNSIHAMTEDSGVLDVSLDTKQLNREAARHYEGLEPGGYVRLTVTDTGNGIEPAFMERLFDPYFTTKDVDQGLGLGLAVVHGIVKKHKGAVKIKSEVGKGTTVEVLFPLIKEQTDTGTDESQPR